MDSLLPPSMMSVPRPAMFVATVTAPLRPACATICASRSWCFALSTSCGMPLAAQQLREVLGLLDARGADEDRLALLVALDDVLDDGGVLGLLGAVDQVGLVDALHRRGSSGSGRRRACRSGELGGLGHGRTGHAAELVVEAEEVLQRDRGERLVLLLDLDALLRLDRLVHALVVAAAGQDAAGVLVDDQDLAVHDDVVLVELEQLLGLERVVQVADERGVDRLVEVVDAEPVLDLRDAGLEDADGALLLVDLVVLVEREALHDLGELDVPLLRLVGRAADDQRRARLVDEDRVDLVDDGEVVAALHQLVLASTPCCRAGSRSRTRCSCRR